MTTYRTEITVRRKRRQPQIKSISTYWLIAVAAIAYAAGFLAYLV